MALPVRISTIDASRTWRRCKRLVQQKCPEWTDHNVSDPASPDGPSAG